jgi:hypothetical protein
VKGVGDDLVVKPLQWKGNTLTVRDFNRGAGHNELGMQAVEIVGEGIDGDGDGVVNEFGYGDMTALAIYLAAQPRPVSQLELADLGLLVLSDEQRQAILRGTVEFDAAGCADCHRSELLINVPTFSEPSTSAIFRDLVFPAGQDPIAVGVDPNNAVVFDLTQDPPDNVVDVGGSEVHLGPFEADGEGRAIVRLYGDLKLHDMGPRLAESIDETGVGAATWLTKELWGVGSTAPYLHDGRATTLSEAILEHGGEAQDSRQNFSNLPAERRADLVAFLSNLVLLKLE